MATIQDIHQLEEQICDIAQDYIGGSYNPDDVLVIGRRCGRLTLKADAREAIKPGKSTELYPMKDLLRKNEKGVNELDFDKISEIANKWVFLG